MKQPHEVFVVDCPRCRAKVAAEQAGVAERNGRYDSGEPFGERLHVGECPKCGQLIAGESFQRAFEGEDADYDEWTDVVRVYPKPPKQFTSSSIPKVVTQSLNEADRALQADASTAACVMMGRALEALCRDKIRATPSKEASRAGEKIMLGRGIKFLKEQGTIDERLFNWSQELQAFRNIAAHPDDTVISRDDAEDLQSFVYAIVEYVYDLAERYEEFKERTGKRRKR